MLDFLPKDTYVGDSHFVVLDDTVYRGLQMQKHVRRLQTLGVDRKRITTAALIVHEKSGFTPDLISRKLDDRAYVEWKDGFTRLVRTQRRSTDRDHPLYFFELDGLSSGAMLSILQTFGDVASIDDESFGAVYAFSVAMDCRAILSEANIPVDLWDVEGLKLENLCKIRLYWEEIDGRMSLTLVPMVFATLDLEAFEQARSQAFPDLAGIELSSLDYLRPNEDARGRFAFFLLSRSIAAKVLEQFLTGFVANLTLRGSTIRRMEADQQDFPIKYVFPEPYEKFYAWVCARVDILLKSSFLSAERMPLFRPGTGANIMRSHYEICGDSGLPPKYGLLRILCREADAASFDGKEWVPNEDYGTFVTYSTFLSEIPDPLLVSRGLDELLDSGLLRAGDANIAPAGLRPVYSRVYRPGGEFNAVLVSRLALSCRTVTPPESYSAHEHFDSWGEE